MSRRFLFSPRITIIGAILIVSMLGLSRWQWNRHLEKKELIATLERRLQLPPATPAENISELMTSPEQFYFRKVLLQGEFDYEREILIKNRRHEKTPGVLIVTPLRIADAEVRILVNRGFIPLALLSDNDLEQFRPPQNEPFVGIVKEPVRRKLFGPPDPPASKEPWQQEFLRFDIEHLADQFPYPLAPVYVERMAPASNKEIKEAIVTGSSDKEEMLLLPLRAIENKKRTNTISTEYPIPFFSTVIPPGRHLGYVFEWATMAGMTFLVCLVLQFRRPRRPLPPATTATSTGP